MFNQFARAHRYISTTTLYVASKKVMYRKTQTVPLKRKAKEVLLLKSTLFLYSFFSLNIFFSNNMKFSCSSGDGKSLRIVF